MSVKDSGTGPLLARVDKVFAEGAKPFAVTYPLQEEPSHTDGRGITFSLDPAIWRGAHAPFPGEIVELDDIVETTGGLRAMRVKPAPICRLDRSERKKTREPHHEIPR